MVRTQKPKADLRWQQMQRGILYFKLFSDTTQRLIKEAYTNLKPEDDEEDDDFVAASILLALNSPNIKDRDRILLKHALSLRLKEIDSAEGMEADFNIAAYDIPKNYAEECIELVVEVEEKVLDTLLSSIYNEYCKWKNEPFNSNKSAEDVCLAFIDHCRSPRKSFVGKAPRREKVGQSYTEPKAFLSTSPIDMSLPTRESRITQAIALSAMGRPHGRIEFESEEIFIINCPDPEDSRWTLIIMACEEDLDNLCYRTSEADSQSKMRTAAERSRNHGAGERLHKTYFSSQAPVQDNHERPGNVKLEEGSRKRKRASCVEE